MDNPLSFTLLLLSLIPANCLIQLCNLIEIIVTLSPFSHTHTFLFCGFKSGTVAHIPFTLRSMILDDFITLRLTFFFFNKIYLEIAKHLSQILAFAQSKRTAYPTQYTEELNNTQSASGCTCLTDESILVIRPLYREALQCLENIQSSLSDMSTN